MYITLRYQWIDTERHDTVGYDYTSLRYQPATSPLATVDRSTERNTLGVVVGRTVTDHHRITKNNLNKYHLVCMYMQLCIGNN